MSADAELLPLPPQPQGLPWPTTDFPEGELDPRVDRAALDALLDRAFSEPEPDDLEQTHGVAIVHRGKLVAERYRTGKGPDDTFLSWSMAKSVTCAMVGVLVRQGRLEITDPMPVPEWAADDERSRITIDQMLRMVDGLRFREAEHLGGGSVRYYAPDESDVIPMLFGDGKGDVAAYASTLPYLNEPEAVWNYNSGASNLLARLVGQTVGGGKEATLKFMREEFFEPIGMTTADPHFDDAGTFIGSSTFYASIRDYARFGYLHLRGGIWDGQRILPEGWVDYIRTPSPQSEGTYGAHFWTIPGSLGIFYCSGMGGQRILMSPKLDLVVVRSGKTAPEKTGAVVQYCKSLIDLFRPTA